MSSNPTPATNSVTHSSRESGIVHLESYRQMRQSGMTQENASQAIGVPRSTVQHWDE
ncbi:helix-turn-helix transcriptional regulator [Deltaproteobacteria bacterium TL4]